MKREVLGDMAKESSYLAILFVASVLGFKVAFYKESIGVVVRTVASLFWLFVIPGYCVMLHWRGNIRFAERFVIGIFAAGGVIGIASYYIGLLGLNVKYHAVLLPLLLIIGGIAGAGKRDNHR